MAPRPAQPPRGWLPVLPWWAGSPPPLQCGVDSQSVAGAAGWTTRGGPAHRGPAIARRAGGDPGGLPQPGRTAIRGCCPLHVVGSPAAHHRPGLARRAPSPAPGAAATPAWENPPPRRRRARCRGVLRPGGPASGCGAAKDSDRAVVTMLMAWLVPAAGPVRDRLTATIDRL